MLRFIILHAGAALIVGAPVAFAYQLALGDACAGIACALGLVVAGCIAIGESYHA